MLINLLFMDLRVMKLFKFSAVKIVKNSLYVIIIILNFDYSVKENEKLTSISR